MLNANLQDTTHLHISQKNRGVAKFIRTINCDLFLALENVAIIAEAYSGTALDGDPEEAGALALSPLKTGTLFGDLDLELKLQVSSLN